MQFPAALPTVFLCVKMRPQHGLEIFQDFCTAFSLHEALLVLIGILFCVCAMYSTSTTSRYFQVLDNSLRHASVHVDPLGHLI